MKKAAFFACMACVITITLQAQNVFNPADTLVNWDSTRPVGSVANPNQWKAGLQKWVRVPTNSVSIGYGAFDVSSYKSYMINIGNVRVAFRIKFPYSYTNPDSASKKYPVMLFFHGAGEPGCPANGGLYNNEKQLLNGGKFFRDVVDNNQFDGFLLYPQVVVGNDCSSAWPTVNDGPVLAFLDSLTKYARMDADRLFVNGLSDGGRQTWRWARTYPQRIASVGPASMSAMTSDLGSMIHIPVFFGTGGKDSNPSPAQAQATLTTFTNLGGDIKYILYPNLGHSVWNQLWAEPDYIPFMNKAHKANPLVFFQRYDWCAGAAISAKLGLTAGFYAYEWQKDNVTIATSTGGVNTIVNASVVQTFTGNEIVIKAYGTYRARFKRTASSAWSAFSPIPAVIGVKSITQTAPIQVSGLHSQVLPSLDGSTTVPLTLPSGFLNYRYYRASDNSLLASQQNYNAGIGTVRAKYDEKYGCGSNFSPDFTVVNAAGTPKPPAAASLAVSPLTQTSLRLNWVNPPNPPSNETGFEIYRATSPGGPYTFAGVAAADTTAYIDTALVPNTSYYYVVRAVNTTGAAAKSNEASSRTLVDNTPPIAPPNVRYAGSTPYSVSLAWNSSQDNIRVKRYDIYINGVKYYSTTDTSFTVNNLDSLKWYAFTVRAVDGSGNASAPSPQVLGFTHNPGMNYKYYNGSFSVLPDFNALTPVKTGITSSINTGNSFRTQADDYAIMWQGYLYVPQTANYTFATNSDEGSRVYIDVPYSASATPVVDNDGLHAASVVYSTVPLTKGYHQIVVTYFEHVNTEVMRVYWTNDAGLDISSLGNYVTATMVPGVPPLIAPSQLAATAQSFNKIRLTWTDNSANETGFEILRSTTSGGPYVAAGSVGPNVTAFNDSALASATTYYYEVRAVGAQSESPYTSESFATTAAAPGTPIAPSGLTAQNTSPTFIALSWVDNADNEDNIQVWRSITAASNYQLLATLPANTNSYTDAAVTAFAKYYYYVVGVNGNGKGQTSDSLAVIAGNNAPTITALARMVLKTDATSSQGFSVSDPGDIVSVSIDNNPSFIKIQNTGTNTYNIVLAPTADNIGSYNLLVKATDSKGAATTTPLVIQVNDKNTRSVFVNFGSAGKTAPFPWNNWTGVRGANNVISNLKDENNATTGFSLTTVNAWSGLTDLGHLTGNNSGAVPDSVLQSGLADNGVSKQLKISGLNAAMRYNIVLIGSQNEGLDASADYATGTQHDTLNARYNTNQTANLNRIVPDAGGSIIVNITRLPSAATTYLNGLIIEEYAPVLAVLDPVNLLAETVDRTRINLSWSDRSDNENVADGFELTRATDSLFTSNVVVTNLPRNTSVYQSTGLNPSTRYWFRVRAKSGAQFSGYSNRSKAVTPASTVYVNFNANVANGSAPWNNTVAQPTSPTTFSNLLNQAGLNSGLSLKIEQIFNGEFSAGVVTGNNSGVVPDNVLKSDYWLDKTQLSTIRLSGLNQTRKYRIGFFGSSGPQGWYKDNYTATYTVNGQTRYLNSWANSTKIVYINDVLPDDGGEAVLNFSTTAAAAFGFNGGVIIDDYVDSSTLAAGNPVVLAEAAAEETANEHVALPNRMYPNPFAGSITIDYNNEGSETKAVALMFDSEGRLVYRQEFGHLVKGYNQLQLETQYIRPNGKAFTIVLSSNGKVLMTTKMVGR